MLPVPLATLPACGAPAVEGYAPDVATSTSTAGTTAATTSPGGSTPTGTSATGSTGTGSALPGDPVEDIEASVDDRVPLVVEVRWNLLEPATCHVEYREEDEADWRASPPFEAEAGAASEILLGLHEDVEVVFRVVAETDGGTFTSEEQVARTGLLPPDVPHATATLYDPTRADPAPYVVGMASTDAWFTDWFLYIIDRDGRYVWFLQDQDYYWEPFLHLSADGNSILFNDASFYGGMGVVKRVRLDGRIVEEIPALNITHAFDEIEDGGVAWPAVSGGCEEILERSPDGTVTSVFDATAWLESVGENTRCDHNSIDWDPERDTYLLSWWDHAGVIEIDRATYEVIRVFGDLPGAYAFDPPESAFYAQHGPRWTPQGTILTTSSKGWGGETTAMEYAVHDDTHTLELVWSFGDGMGWSAPQIGEAIRLPSGNTLVNYGTIPAIREATPDGELVWEVLWETDAAGRGGVLGRMEPVEDLYRLTCRDCDP